MNIGQDTVELLVFYTQTAYIRILMKRDTMEKIYWNVLKFRHAVGYREKNCKTDRLKSFVPNLTRQGFVKFYQWIKMVVYESIDKNLKDFTHLETNRVLYLTDLKVNFDTNLHEKRSLLNYLHHAR